MCFRSLPNATSASCYLSHAVRKYITERVLHPMDKLNSGAMSLFGFPAEASDKVWCKAHVYKCSKVTTSTWNNITNRVDEVEVGFPSVQSPHCFQDSIVTALRWNMQLFAYIWSVSNQLQYLDVQYQQWKETTSTGKFFGCGEVNLIRISGSTLETSSRRVVKFRPFPRDLHVDPKPGASWSTIVTSPQLCDVWLVSM